MIVKTSVAGEVKSRTMPGSVRIIAGKWRRHRLKVPDIPGLRPTPDRVRETLFNWLDERLVGARCLDLFAGSGALGFEAASRGAAEVVLVEEHEQAANLLRAEAAHLKADQVRVVAADAFGWLRASSSPFDIVFLDPPYDSVDLGELCARLERDGWLAAGGVVYLESRGPTTGLDLPSGWQMLRQQKAGQVRYHLAAPGPDGVYR